MVGCGGGGVGEYDGVEEVVEDTVGARVPSWKCFISTRILCINYAIKYA